MYIQKSHSQCIIFIKECVSNVIAKLLSDWWLVEVNLMGIVKITWVWASQGHFVGEPVVCTNMRAHLGSSEWSNSKGISQAENVYRTIIYPIDCWIRSFNHPCVGYRYFIFHKLMQLSLSDPRDMASGGRQKGHLKKSHSHSNLK